MKFPKSVHAEGWGNHLETTKPEHLPDALKEGGRAPMHAAKFGAGRKIDVNAPLGTPATSTLSSATPPLKSPTAPAVAPVAATRIDPQPAVRPQPQATHAATLPPRDDTQRNWMIAASAGAAIVAALAVWGVNRHHADQATPPAAVTGSTEPQTQVADATPAPDAAASQAAATPDTTTVASADNSTGSSSTSTPAAETVPQRLGLPVTTSKPAVEPRTTVAQADTPPAPRPDLVVRSNPRDAAPAPVIQPAPSPALQPRVIAAAPTPAATPDTIPQGTAPINLPPTSAGVPAPATATPTTPTTPTTPAAVTPQAVTSPVATTTPDTTANPAAATGTPPMAQAQPVPAAPSPEDAGITQQVRVALASEATLAGLPIAVSTDHGVVKLEGQAPDAQSRERATVVAASTSGVKAVDNRLTVPPVATLSQAPSSL